MTFPENVQPIEKKDTFGFKCHTGVSCFNECCRELELVLSPYDVLRLRKILGLSSSEFLDRHAVVEFTENHPFPLVYLGMVDDGRASCPFVTDKGCLVYKDRPAACRTYPVGRGASMMQGRQVNEQYVLLKEAHCQGFDESQQQSVEQWEKDQEIAVFNTYNDKLMLLTQHPKLRRGMRLSQEQAELFVTALYDLDSFQKSTLFIDHMKEKGQDTNSPLDDVLVLENAIEILLKQFFR